jgi:hypothetical protein
MLKLGSTGWNLSVEIVGLNGLFNERLLEAFQHIRSLESLELQQAEDLEITWLDVLKAAAVRHSKGSQKLKLLINKELMRKDIVWSACRSRSISYLKIRLLTVHEPFEIAQIATFGLEEFEFVKSLKWLCLGHIQKFNRKCGSPTSLQIYRNS